MRFLRRAQRSHSQKIPELSPKKSLESIEVPEMIIDPPQLTGMQQRPQSQKLLDSSPRKLPKSSDRGSESTSQLYRCFSPPKTPLTKSVSVGSFVNEAVSPSEVPRMSKAFMG